MLPPGSLLLAGLPATGKSAFGNWLEQHKGYFHLDFDEEHLVQQRGFGQAQDLLWHQRQAAPLICGLLARQQPIVLSWGFAPHFLPTVRQLLTFGFAPVWFTATPTIARQAFIARGGIGVRYFDQHMAPLRPLEEDILAVFGDHVLQPLRRRHEQDQLDRAGHFDRPLQHVGAIHQHIVAPFNVTLVAWPHAVGSGQDDLAANGWNGAQRVIQVHVRWLVARWLSRQRLRNLNCDMDTVRCMLDTMLAAFGAAE